jgi:hypothetical protein
MIIYCGTCGCPRDMTEHPCPECRDVQFSIHPTALYSGEAGWLARGPMECEAETVIVQGDLFAQETE